MHAAFLLAPAARAETIDRIVAIVNDDIVTQSDMGKFAERLRKGGLTDDLLVPDEATKQTLLKEKPRLLRVMIDEKILDSEVRRQGLSVPFERVEQEIRTIASRNNLSRDELKLAIADKGISFSQYQEFIKTGLERQSLIAKQVTTKIKVSEDEVNGQYGAAHRDQKGQLYDYTLAHILFLADMAGSKARERAERVLEKLRAGGDFEKLAADYSEDPNFSAGGLLGTFRSGEFLKELEEPVQKLASGQISGVIPTKTGFHILKLIKKVAAADPAAEKEKERIRAALYDKALKKQFQSWLEQMRQDAFIRINDKTLVASGK
jgi:peptidyl-prolyl cis-trans isomerase SurA